jgi:N-acetylneuraminic acid mutarotase
MTWTAVANLNTARQGLAVATAPAPSPAAGLVLYAMGGDGGANSNAIGTVETFDPAAPGSWTNNVTTLPGQALTGLAAATLASQVHVFGGTRGGPVITPVTTHNIFDPATNSWATSSGSLTTARAYHAAVTATDGGIYAIGGVDGGGNALNSVERYDPVTHTWSGMASMHAARSGLAACVVGDNIYAIGGEDINGVSLTTVEVFNTVTRVWNAVALPSLPHPRTHLAAALGPGAVGLIYAIGGLSSTTPATPAADIYTWDQSMSSSWQTVSSSPLAAATGLLAATLGPDGRLYAVGGNATVGNAAATRGAEVFTAGVAQPQPYIGNGTYQSPDIILKDLSGNTIPPGGQPTGPWDTQLAPNTHYALSVQIHNDSGVAAPDTVVRFWSFPGGVGTAGTLLSEVVTTIAAGGTLVASPVQFLSAGDGQHECAVVSLSDAQAPFINVDATSAAQVPDPTIAHPGGSAHYASAWRNTDSTLLGPGHIWHLPFTAGTWLREPLPIKIEVTAAKVPVGFEETGEAAKLRDDLRLLGATPRTPLFLAPRVRAGLDPAPELDISISMPGKEEFERLGHGDRRELRTSHKDPAHFTVRGRIPGDAKPGEAFLVDVGAHYPEGEGRPARTVRWLQVLYVTDRLIPREDRYDE